MQRKQVGQLPVASTVENADEVVLLQGGVLKRAVASILPGGVGGTGSWGGITGTLSNQTDLQAALNAKAASAHGHTVADVTGLQGALDGKTAVGHSHIVDNVTGLQGALDAKADANAVKTVTSVAGGIVPAVAGDVRVMYNPASAPAQTIVLGRSTIFEYDSTQSNSGVGHTVADIAWYKQQNTGNPQLAIAHEAKIDNETAGTITNAKGYESQLASNAGTITNLEGVASRITGNAGTVGQFTGYKVDITANAGTVASVYGFHFPNLGAVAGITAKFAFINQDADAPMLSAAPIIDQSLTYSSPNATGFTVNVPARKQALLMTPVAGYAAGTINLPAKATLFDGQTLEVTTSQSVTAVTWGANGAAFVLNAPSGLSAGQTVRLKYFQAIDWWVCLSVDGAAGGSQPLDAELTAIAGLVSAANKLPYFTGAGTASLTDLSTFIRTLLDDADAATARGTLGVPALLTPVTLSANTSLTAAAHANRTIWVDTAGVVLTINNDAGGGWTSDDALDIQAVGAGTFTLVQGTATLTTDSGASADSTTAVGKRVQAQHLLAANNWRTVSAAIVSGGTTNNKAYRVVGTVAAPLASGESSDLLSLNVEPLTANGDLIRAYHRWEAGNEASEQQTVRLYLNGTLLIQTTLETTTRSAGFGYLTQTIERVSDTSVRVIPAFTSELNPMTAAWQTITVSSLSAGCTISIRCFRSALQTKTVNALRLSATVERA